MISKQRMKNLRLTIERKIGAKLDNGLSIKGFTKPTDDFDNFFKRQIKTYGLHTVFKEVSSRAKEVVGWGIEQSPLYFFEDLSDKAQEKYRSQYEEFMKIPFAGKRVFFKVKGDDWRTVLDYSHRNLDKVGTYKCEKTGEFFSDEYFFTNQCREPLRVQVRLSNRFVSYKISVPEEFKCALCHERLNGGEEKRIL